MTTIFRVIQQGKSFAVQSQNAEGGKLMKCNIVFQDCLVTDLYKL